MLLAGTGQHGRPIAGELTLYFGSALLSFTYRNIKSVAKKGKENEQTVTVYTFTYLLTSNLASIISLSNRKYK